MAYTVKQVSAMSGVSVRTLHFYHHKGLLKPAYCGANGYRYYEEPQLLTLQQILFYRELGFELKRIPGLLGRTKSKRLAALRSHRKTLEAEQTRLRTLIGTIDKTIHHLQGATKMKSEEMFEGFRVAAGKDRFDEDTKVGGEPIHCKLSGEDTEGAMCVFEFAGSGGGPQHVHHEQDEWIYILEGEFDFVVGGKRFIAGPGQSVFMPRSVPHCWGTATGRPGRIVNTYQPAGRMEGFFREVAKYPSEPQVHPEALTLDKMRRLFQDHEMEVTGPPHLGKWHVDEQGRITGSA